MKYISLILIFILIIFNKAYTLENKILFKVNNEIITTYDINIEENYLKILDPNINNLNNEEIKKIAINSAINEKIKLIELKKYYKIGENLNDPNLIDLIKRIYTNLSFENEQEFIKHLKKTNQSFELIKKKIQIESYWNNLIFNKFMDKVSINQEKIKQEIYQQIEGSENINKYFLSEIVFKNKKGLNLENMYKEIEESIYEIGFNNTANIYSQSDTSKLGGKIGWIEETSLSENVRLELNKISKGEHTLPIRLQENYIILKIEDIKSIKLDFDLKKIIEQRTDFEINKQLERFSTAFFNRVKQNIQINEF